MVAGIFTRGCRRRVPGTTHRRRRQRQNRLNWRHFIPALTENALSNAIPCLFAWTGPDILLFCQYVVRPKFNSFKNNSSVHSPVLQEVFAARHRRSNV